MRPPSDRASVFRDAARRRAYTNAFISLSAEVGDGPVVAVKDVVDVAGLPTTAGSAVLPATPARCDAPLIARIRRAGCVIVGKANMHEFALGVSSVNPHFGAVHNPAAPGFIAGGSSGGSAAAVGFELCDWALGSDTAGSIRIPASLCGVVGLKPTTGVIPTEATIPVSPTLDTLGPLARDVATVATAFAAMSDATGPPLVEGPRLCVAAGWGADLHPDIAAAWHARTDGLPSVDFPDVATLRRVCATIMRFEAAQWHRPLLETAGDHYGSDVRQLLNEALAVSEADYRQALDLRSALTEQAEQALAPWDAMLAPATRNPALPIGVAYANQDYADYTRPFSVTGQPVLVLPAGETPKGHPVGIQVIAQRGADLRLLGIGLALERAWQVPAPLAPEGDHVWLQ